MLDLTNWEDGVIYDWKDKDVACELEIPLATLRDHRRKLEDNLYIKTTIKRYGLQIAITNWTNPREYTGDLYNEIQSDEIPLPSNENPCQSDTESDTEVNTESDTEGSEILTPLHLTHRFTSSQSTDHIFINEKKSKRFIELSETFLENTKLPKSSINQKYEEDINLLIDMKVTPKILDDAMNKMFEKGYVITSPGSCIRGCAIEMQRRTAKEKKDAKEDQYAPIYQKVKIDPDKQKELNQKFGVKE
jgi:hypothetical protein